MSSNDPKRQRDMSEPGTGIGDQPPVDPRDEVLVAYLDGELSDADTEQIETKLASDVDLRQRLRNLQATWDMLDELPRKEPDRAFLKSTIEMVVTSAQKKKVKWHRWPIRIGLMLTAFALASLVAIQVVRSVQTRPYRQFVANLDLFENLDVYEQIQDVTFLEALQQSGVFANDHVAIELTAEKETHPTGDLPNQQRFKSLSATRIEQLKQAQTAFEVKPRESQQHLRRLHQQITRHRNYHSLMQTAKSYSRWLQTIAAKTRYEIAETPIAERVKKVLEVRRAQMLEWFGRKGPTGLPGEDVVPLMDWWKGFMEKKKNTILDRIIDEMDGADDALEALKKWNTLRRFEFLMSMNPQAVFDQIEESDVSELQSAVTDSAANILSGRSLADQRTLIERWLVSASATIREVPVEKLWNVYVGLDTDQKSALDGLPRDELIEILRQKYLPPSGDDETWRLFQQESDSEPRGSKDSRD